MNKRSNATQRQIARYIDREIITTQYDNTTQYEDETENITYKKLFLEV